ncbi:MAG: hypothetical protein MJB14_17750 [Spirochaetes bacterium]|nr:hypothetical protein [Spirochaetota bacterium]
MNDTVYTNKIFLNAVLPLLKTIIQDCPKLALKWQGKNAIIQVSCLREEEKDGTHFIITDGEWTVVRGVSDIKPQIELEFNSREHLNRFFKGKLFPFPKIKGFLKNPGYFFNFMAVLMKMSGLLGATQPPKGEGEKGLLVKLYFYLLSTAISTLNKLEHPEIHKWALASPDRVYAWEVQDREDLSAYIRIKAGNSKSSRGKYKRSLPFFTMKFDSTDSALGILMSIDDMIESTVKGKLIMVGGPEYGAQLGEYMLKVGSYIQ